MIVELMQESKYISIMSENMVHTQALLEATKDREKAVGVGANDGINLFSVGQDVRNILAIGQDTHWAILFFLLTNKTSKVYCLGLNEQCYNHFKQHFPERITQLTGDTLDSLCVFKDANTELKMDIVLIDGSHDWQRSNLLFFNAREMTNAQSVLVWGGPANLFAGYEKDDMISPFSLWSGELQLAKFVWSERNIGVCTLALGEHYKDLVKYGIISRRLYCAKQGYNLHEDEDTYDQSRPMAWSKINLLRRYLPKYDYVVWIDADSYIMDDSKRLEDIIDGHMDGADMMVAQDWKLINTGVIFIKNTEWSRKFLDLIYDQVQHMHSPNWEQSAFIDLLEHNISDSKNHIKVLDQEDQNLINAYWFTYKYGEVFILHFPGCWRDEEEHGLSLAMHRHCPLRKEDDTDETYAGRMHWLQFGAEDEASAKVKAQALEAS